jgi:hypothetical protein
MFALAGQDRRHTAAQARLDETRGAGAAGTMKASGDTDKDGDKQAKPAKDSPAPEPARPGSASATPRPPSEGERASAAQSNPLRTPADSERAEGTDHPEDRDQAEDKKQAEDKEQAEENERAEDEERRESASDRGSDDQAAPKRAGGDAPELRISANMLSAKPPAGRPTEQGPPPTVTETTRHRRRVRDPAIPIDPGVINPISLIWPRANSRRGARRASRYGLVGFIMTVIWAFFEFPTEAINKVIGTSSVAAATSAVIGLVVVFALIAIGYYYHSRLAALVSLAGGIALVVVDYQADVPSILAIAAQAVTIYLLLHGVHGTIAYHVFGRRKRRKGGGYHYRSD